MPSVQSPKPDPSPARRLNDGQKWAYLLEKFLDVLEDQSPRLNEEASYFGLSVPLEGWVSTPLQANRPEQFLRLWRARNPSLSLDRLQQSDPYDLAVGVLRLLA